MRFSGEGGAGALGKEGDEQDEPQKVDDHVTEPERNDATGLEDFDLLSYLD